ncbi:MAG TPA: HD domain-containing phosphohydrolase [Longimicrobium sp.]|nr:HD domain-containing phosphohydrolase [Longimicrobium sp.]
MNPSNTAPPPDATDGLVAAARAAEREGRRPEARVLYEAALHSLPGTDQAPLAGSLLRWIARTHQDEGNVEVAAEIAATALVVSERSGDAAGVAHAHNLIGSVEQARGDLALAEEHYTRALRQARAAGELQLAAMVEQNLGTIANIHGDFRAALRRYRRSLAIHRGLGRSAYVAHALNNVGMLCTDLGRWRSAERAFDEALELCAELGDDATSARIAGNRIEPWIARGRWAEARDACGRARELAKRAGDTGTLGEVWKHLGVIERETGHAGQALRHLERAGKVARDRGDLLLEGEVAREQATVHWGLRDHRNTLQALNRAHGLFSRLQARRELAEVDARLSELESTFLAIVEQWGESIESADRYTQGHCERVANYACALAAAAGVEPGVLLWFRMGALLHDVGKIVVPPEILNKPGALTPEERALMERHPDAGVELIGDMDFPWDIRPMVRHHHEAWDGSGYPARLAGDGIPLSARILCVADIYDALATDRPYRPAFRHDQTLEIMAADAGRKLDPALFALFRDLDLAAVGPSLAAA